MTTLFSENHDTTEFDFAQCHDSRMIFGTKDVESEWVENNPCCFC